MKTGGMIMTALKKTVSILLCILLLAGGAAAGNIPASADVSDYFTYGITSDYAILMKCSDKAEGEITVPDTAGGLPVKAIGREAFKGCGKITKIVLPDSVTSVNDYAFSDCERLRSVKLSLNTAAIGNFAFFNCRLLGSAEIPSSVIRIGNAPFAGCPSLENIVINGENEYYGIKGNCLVYIPGKTLIAGVPSGVIPSDGSVTVINDYAFFGCSGLGSVTVPECVSQIGAYAFCDCSAISSINIPANVVNIGSRAFAGCDSLGSLTVSATNANYRSENNCIIDKQLNSVVFGCKTSVIPDDGSVTAVADNAFFGCSGLDGIVIPDCITSVGANAFAGCDGAASAYIGEGVSSIGAGAFSFCGSLGEIEISPRNTVFVCDGNCVINTKTRTVAAGCKTSEIPQNSGVEAIGDYAFYGCSGLTGITIPQNIKEIGKHAFASCGDLAAVALSGSTRKIGDNAFEDCVSLISVNIPYGLKTVGYSAFAGCSALAAISLPGSVESLGDSAFADCTALRNAGLPSGLTQLGNYLFYNCKNLSEVTIPSSVLYIGGSTFAGCSSLGSITLPSGLRSIGVYAFSGCESLNRAVLPESVVSVGANAFEFCRELRTAKIPATLTSVSYRMFYGCTNLKEITLPLSVTAIGAEAFKGCSSLRNVFYAGTVSDKEKIEIGQGNAEILNAVWNCAAQPENYTITFNANGGSEAPAGQSGRGEIIISLSRPVRSGYSFLGWSSNQLATTPQYQPGEKINLTASVTLYAVWKKNETPATDFTLEFDAGEGTGAPGNMTGFGTVVLPGIKPVRSGYVFAGWSVEKGSQSVRYKPGDRYYLKADSTLYAVWKVSPSAKLNVPKNGSVSYRTNVTLNITGQNLPDDCAIVIYNGSQAAAKSKNNSALSYKTGEMKKSAVYTVRVIDSKGDVLKDSAGAPMENEIKVTVNTGFFAWLFAAIRDLFGIAQPVREFNP